jgi:hypothetical protein
MERRSNPVRVLGQTIFGNPPYNFDAPGLLPARMLADPSRFCLYNPAVHSGEFDCIRGHTACALNDSYDLNARTA